MVEANGRLGTITSSAFKEAVKPMDEASEAILAPEDQDRACSGKSLLSAQLKLSEFTPQTVANNQ